MFLEKLYASKDTGAIDTKAGWLDDWQEKMAGDNENIEYNNEKNKEYDEEFEEKALLTCKTAEDYWEEVCDQFDELELFESIETYYEDENFFEESVYEEVFEDDFVTSVTYKSHHEEDFEVTWRIKGTIYKILEMKNVYKVITEWTNPHNESDNFGELGANADLKVVFKEGKSFDSAYAQEALRWYVEDIAYNVLEQIEEENRD
jgi:hypothetical protein